MSQRGSRALVVTQSAASCLRARLCRLAPPRRTEVDTCALHRLLVRADSAWTAHTVLATARQSRARCHRLDSLSCSMFASLLRPARQHPTSSRSSLFACSARRHGFLGRVPCLLGTGAVEGVGEELEELGLFERRGVRAATMRDCQSILLDVAVMRRLRRGRKRLTRAPWQQCPPPAPGPPP